MKRPPACRRVCTLCRGTSRSSPAGSAAGCAAAQLGSASRASRRTIAEVLVESRGWELVSFPRPVFVSALKERWAIRVADRDLSNHEPRVVIRPPPEASLVPEDSREVAAPAAPATMLIDLLLQTPKFEQY